ncbi:MAG TPA: CHASE2 domain-containing protein [Luteimonas sp.]|nr:CHASE2 domain-containing protein [Luteimonas sp.]
MGRKPITALLSWLDAGMAASAHAFTTAWSRVERSYQRPFSRVASRLKFAFYPLLAVGALFWLGWDWTHARSLDSAEDAIFDQVIRWRPIEPAPSGRVVVVEIDDCSIEHFRALGEGGWPWSRQRHADLLDQLDRAGVRAVGYDVLFPEHSPQDPVGDATLEAMAEGGNGRFVFGASRVHSDFDTESGAIAAAEAPNAFPIAIDARKPGPRIALLLPYGPSMAKHSALLDPTRGGDAVIRDVPLRESFGGWGVPTLPLQLAVADSGRAPQSFPASVRVNWRVNSRLPSISAADVIEGRTVCRAANEALPPLKGRIVLVGYNASGLNDAKPTPVDAAMPGVEVLAEATEALVSGSAIWMPPPGLKYLLAGWLVLLPSFAFFRGEPANDVDAAFVATNLLLLFLAFCGLTFFGVFFDIFASIGFLSLCFGLCRLYAGVQRGRAVGNGDFREEFDPSTDRWLVMARLRFVPYPSLDAASAARRRREYRRRLRRFLYSGREAVMLDGVVERKSWLHGTLDDLMLLAWKGADETSARESATRDLDALHAQFNRHDDRLDDDGIIKVSIVAAAIDDDRDNSDRGERLRLREVLGRVLNDPDEWPLRARNTFTETGTTIAMSTS